MQASIVDRYRDECIVLNEYCRATNLTVTHMSARVVAEAFLNLPEEIHQDVLDAAKRIVMAEAGGI